MFTSKLSPARGALRSTLAIGAASILVLASCSTEREGASADGATTGSEPACQNAEQAQAQYKSAWTGTAEAMGLETLEPVDEEVCEIDTSEWAAEPSQGDSYRIALAAQGPINSWGMISEEAFRMEAERQGAEVLYASANGDATEQVNNVQQLASQSPDAMVVVPMGEGITAQVAAATAQGIVVVCSGILPESSNAVSTVTRQYDLLGAAYAEWLVQELDGKGSVAMLSGLAGVPTAEYQAAAAKKVFEKYPDIKVVTQEYTQWSPTVGKTVARNLITKFPNLDGIWSDAAYADLGVVQAYREAGKKVPPMTGDSTNAFLKAVDGSDIKFALSTFPPDQSIDCLRTALQILKGEPVLNKVYIDSPSFTHEKASEYVRKDCSDDLMYTLHLTDEELAELELCK
jgi:ribose transport system substrate-binding protein